MIQLRANTAGLRDKAAAIRRVAPALQQRVSIDLASWLCVRCARKARERAFDTGRWMRAWQQNAVTLKTMDDGAVTDGPPVDLRESRFHKKIFPRLNGVKKRYLEYERSLLAERAAEMGAVKPNKGRLRRIEQQINKCRAIIWRVQEQLEAIDKSGDEWKKAIRIGPRDGGNLGEFSLRRVDQVIIKVYGGAVRQLAGGAVEVRNKEPHARIVATRTGIVREAMREVKAIDAKLVKPGFVTKMRQLSGKKLAA